jgi:hypothetical protein
MKAQTKWVEPNWNKLAKQLAEYIIYKRYMKDQDTPDPETYGHDAVLPHGYRQTSTKTCLQFCQNCGGDVILGRRCPRCRWWLPHDQH